MQGLSGIARSSRSRLRGWIAFVEGLCLICICLLPAITQAQWVKPAAIEKAKGKADAAKGTIDAAKGAAAAVKGKADAAKGGVEALKGKAEEVKGKLEAEKAKIEAAKAKLMLPTDSAAARVLAYGGIPPNPDLNLPERSIHAIELEKYLALRKPGMHTDAIWSKVFRTRLHPAKYQNQELAGVQEVYGYHPFWVGDAWQSYNFELVNRVGYYAYPVDPKTGDSRGDMQQWLTTGLPAEAHLHGAKVDLVVALYGAAQVTALLDNKAAQERLIGNAIDLLYARGDGINLDFQDIPANRKSAFSVFVIHFFERLKLANPGYELRLTLPLLDWDGVYEFEKYVDVVTAFVITGYDCYGARNGKPGPASVLMSSDQWRKPDLLMSVKTYLEAGLPLDKVILSLPHFGKEWRLTTNERGATVAAIDAVRPYNYFLQPLEGKVHFDTMSSTAYRIGTGLFVTRYYWWDDVPSLSQKYDYVKSKGLRGIGIWALGYDNGRDELWGLLSEKFGVPKGSQDTSNVSPKKKQVGPYDRISRSTAGQFRWIGRDTFPLPLAWRNVSQGGEQDDFLLMYGDMNITINKDLGLLLQWILMVLVVFIELGFLITLLRSDFREVVFIQKRGLAYLYFFCTAMLPLLVLRCFGVYVRLEWCLLIVFASLLAASLISARLVAVYHRPKP